MQSRPYELISLLSTAGHVVLSLLMLAVLVSGWRRHRHLGFMVLAMWAGLSSFWLVGARFAYPLLLNAVGAVPGATSNVAWFMVSSLISTLTLHAVFLAGFALLVFRRETPR
jgi:hypothetical protein